MKERLNYQKLLQDWMRFYSMTTERSKAMFASIWKRMQQTKCKTERKGENQNGQ